MTNYHINILNKGAFKLVSTLPNQDMFYGNPYGGAMDHHAATVANETLKQKGTHTLIECTLKAIKLRFNSDHNIVITGADMTWKLNEKQVPLGKITKVKTGCELSGGYAKKGLRSYIAIDRRIKTFGEGEIKLGKKNKELDCNVKTEYNLKIEKNIKIQRGPEWNYLSQDGKETMINYNGIISQDLDRMGAYLEGPEVHLKSNFPKRSVCTFPGVIQLLPTGQLIVLLKDAQTTGGYPRIAYLDSMEQNKFNQLAPGQKLKWRLMF